MRLYRITPEEYLENYSGLGASYQDGARWNKAGKPVLYFALSPSTALLELAQYLPSPRLVPKTYRLGVYECPDDLPYYTLPVNELPKDWAVYPHPQSTQLIGNEWLEKATELGLIVPSSAVPQGLENIIMINSTHADCNKIKLLSLSAELFNERIFTGII